MTFKIFGNYFSRNNENSFINIRQATHNEISEEAAKFKSTKINNHHFQKDAFAKNIINSLFLCC